MAELLGLLAGEFAHAYVRRVGSRLSLTEFPGGDCVLWGGPERGCLVYAARPVQCRTFPFWLEHVKSRAAWERVGRRCPGVNKGKTFSSADIRARLDERAS